MSKKRYNLADFKERRAEQAIEIELPDGSVVTAPPPELWPEGFEKTTDNSELAKKLLGDQYDAFIAGGGTSVLLMYIIKDANSDLDLGESAASSTS